MDPTSPRPHSEAEARSPLSRLEDRIADSVLPVLIQGLLADRGNARGKTADPDDREIHQLSDAAAIVLCRLLFLLRAEACELHRLAEKTAAAYRDAAYEFDQKLSRLFGRASGSPSADHASLSPAPFRVPDRFLASALNRLARDRSLLPPEQKSVDYRSLDIRRLGAIYERLLDSRVRILPGDTTGPEIALVRDRRRRKASGSYYTPDAIVRHIVERTVGPALDRHLEALKTQFPVADGKALLERLFDFRVLDPAMGCGYFLAAAVDFIADRVRRFLSGLPSGRLRRHGDSCPHGDPLKTTVLEHCIYGVDVDPTAVELAGLGLKLHVGDARAATDAIDRHLRCGNALVGTWFVELEQATGIPRSQWWLAPPDCRALLDLLTARHFGLPDAAAALGTLPLHAGSPPAGLHQSLDRDLLASIQSLAADPQNRFFHWEMEFPEVFLGRPSGFHAVIGNPPYLSFSGRQGAALRPRAYFEHHYDCRGWLTLHGLFLQQALRLSRDAVGLIVPDQVGHLAGYSTTREMVLRSHRIDEVRYWGEDVFDGVVTPSLTVIAFREPLRETTTIRHADGTAAATLLRGGAPWVARRPEDRLVENLLRGGSSLGSLVADPGVHTGNCSRKLILRTADTSAAAVPVLEGKQVSPYRCQRPTRALRLDLEPRPGEYFTIRPIEKYRSARFLIRQTASFPIVGPRRYADYFRNSLLALYAPADGIDVRYLVGILNSPLMRFLYQAQVAESSQKAFPQVKIRSLRKLPIRWPDLGCPAQRERHDRLVASVEQMLVLCDPQAPQTQAAPATALTERIAETDRRIQETIYGIYGVSPDERRAIEAVLAGHPATR